MLGIYHVIAVNSLETEREVLSTFDGKEKKKNPKNLHLSEARELPQNVRRGSPVISGLPQPSKLIAGAIVFY